MTQGNFFEQVSINSYEGVDDAVKLRCCVGCWYCGVMMVSSESCNFLSFGGEGHQLSSAVTGTGGSYWGSQVEVEVWGCCVVVSGRLRL